MLRLAALIACLALPAAAQDGVSRTVLQQSFLNGAPDYTVIVSKLVLEPGARIPLHRHPGDEHAVVLTDGTAEMADGSTMTLTPDMTMFFPMGTVHGGVTNTGDAPIEMLTTHVVLATEPFQIPAD